MGGKRVIKTGPQDIGLSLHKPYPVCVLVLNTNAKGGRRKVLFNSSSKVVEFIKPGNNGVGRYKV